jgi:hypothetical protein
LRNRRLAARIRRTRKAGASSCELFHFPASDISPNADPSVTFRFSRFSIGLAAVLGMYAYATPARAQHEHGTVHMMARRPLGLDEERLGSGTSWLPDASLMRALHREWRGWNLMLHGAAFVQYTEQSTVRGNSQLGVTDWEMLTASRGFGGGLVQLNVMTSIEPFVLGPRGYPLILQTGESYRGAAVHDRQHPHDLFIELAAHYEREMGSRAAISVYAAAVGEPAAGPVAFMHRPSAEGDPMAPLGHHWQDASHESFGVVTAGVFTRRVKLEGSVFNAREPDEYRFNLDYRGARLDSYAGRLSVAPASWLTAATWWAYLNDHDRREAESKMHRYGASLLAQRPGVGRGTWATALIWGANVHHHSGIDHAQAHGEASAPPHHRTNSVLLETNFGIGAKDVVFGRLERVQKNGAELGFTGGDLTQPFEIRSVVAGYARTLFTLGRGDLAVGARG